MNTFKHLLESPNKQELLDRIGGLYNAMNKQGQEWDAVFLVDKINHYYFTGTMQDGVFALKRDGSHAYFARRSFERAKEESPLDNIYNMKSYRDVRASLGGNIKNIFLETETITYGATERLKKYFDIELIKPADRIIQKLRAVKSRYELDCVLESGRQHKYLLEDIAPTLFKEGINEAEFMASMYEKMIALGYHGVSRFAMFQTEVVAGQMGFGENSLYPASFDGPGGMKGMYPAAPVVGDRNRFLKKGDLVFIDIGYGVNGYHTDRTQIYMFGKQPSKDILEIHRQCMDIQKKTAAMLKPGAIPSDIYNSVVGGLDKDFLKNFMGFKESAVKFLGHGVGLQIGEFPIIANGFNEPLEKNMVMAVEPKKGMEGVGLVGVEDTYLVTENGGECITGGEKEIIVV